MSPVPSVYKTLKLCLHSQDYSLEHQSLSSLTLTFLLAGFKGLCLVRGACPTVERNAHPVISHTQASGSAGPGCLLVLISCSKSPAALGNSVGTGLVSSLCLLMNFLCLFFGAVLMNLTLECSIIPPVP